MLIAALYLLFRVIRKLFVSHTTELITLSRLEGAGVTGLPQEVWGRATENSCRKHKYSKGDGRKRFNIQSDVMMMRSVNC